MENTSDAKPPVPRPLVKRAGDRPFPPAPAETSPQVPAAPARMMPVHHEGPLPWVQLRNAVFHPAIFRKMVGRIDPRARNGDLVTVYDREAKIFGTGFLNTQSQYGLRMLTLDPTPAREELIEQRLAAAIYMRREVLKLDAATDAYRVVHAEGDGLPGLIVDRLGDYAVVELFGIGMFQRVERVKAALLKLLPLKEVLVRADKRVQDAEGFVMPGSGPEAIQGPTRQRGPDRKSTVICENGIKFQIDLTHGHKTGFFCDQRDNRLRVARYTQEAEVLDMFSYSGGFGIYAAHKGKAKHVTCVDIDEDAIALAQRNANLNQVPRGQFETAHAEAFTYFRQMRGNGKQFDVVVLDPPKLIASQAEFPEGRAKYFDLNKLALSVVKPGGFFITCSCSGLLGYDEFHSVLRGSARGAGRRVQVLETTGPGLDHPFMTEAPESLYLKCLWCRVT